jgi:predicted transcriptional regulator of viral defense system
MKYEELLEVVGPEPLFETGLLMAGVADPPALQRQLSRWVQAGRLTKLRRGLYAIATPYATSSPDPFVVSNRLVRPSYVSLESALHYHEVIPDVPFAVTAVTTGRSGVHDTPSGRFVFHHIRTDRFWGSHEIRIAAGQRGAWIAVPEKALIDLLYLNHSSDDPAYLRELRLQNLQQLDAGVLTEMAARFGSAKVSRAVDTVLSLMREDAEGWTVV